MSQSATEPTCAGRPREITGYQDLHPDATILVCGCGPSLVGLSDPHRHLTIGVNDVGRLFDPTYLVVVNPRSQFKGDRFRYVEESNAQALFTQLDLGRVRPPVVRFRLGTYGGTDVGVAEVLHYTQNSPYVAVCLAAYMGATRIGLIGVDLTDHHFFGQTGRHPLAGRLREIDAQYGRLAAALAKRGVELVNLSSISRLTSLPRSSMEHFAGAQPEAPERKARAAGLRIVSYATTPVAGVPPILARSITHATDHSARCVWATAAYGNGVRFAGDVEWNRAPAEAVALIEQADLVIVHNGKVAPAHQRLLQGKPVVTMAHNYGWNVDMRFVERGWPGVVVGQYQATLPEFAGWAVVPNPIPLWEPAYAPGPKGERVTIAYTPSGPHERYPRDHRLYWHGKGFKTTVAALERLAHRWPLDLQTTARRQVSLDEALAMKRRAHLVIDECVTGSYHRNSLEALAAGCVVVNGLGLVPAIADAFRRCAPEAECPPFVCCSLESLESTLAALIEQGTDRLAEQGRENRRWVETHWNFGDQWERFWRPVVEAARERSARAAARGSTPEGAGHPAHVSEQAGSVTLPTAAPPPAVPMTTTQQPPSRPGPRASVATPPGLVSVVVPHGGRTRLRHLAASLAHLRQCRGIGEIIVADMGPVPAAEETTRRWADKYVYIHHEGEFERARALNVGTGVAECEFVFWTDNDLLLPQPFIEHAVRELVERKLDYLIPYSDVRYLSEADTHEVLRGVRSPAACQPLNVLHSNRPGASCSGGAGLVRRGFIERHGGMIEGFRGWGGEDNAWVRKVGLLGRMATTRRRDQHLHHLFHPVSGGYRGSRPGERNPHYRDNVALLNRVAAIRDAGRFLLEFPPPRHRPRPWAGDRLILLAAHSTDGPWQTFAGAVARCLQTAYGIPSEQVSVSPNVGRERLASADAVVILGGAAERAVTSDGAAPGAGGLIVVTEDAEEGTLGNGPPPSTLQRISLPAPDPAEAERVATRLVARLSVILGARHVASVATEKATLPVWLYWEGPCPDWIEACRTTIQAHAPDVRLLDWAAFDTLRDTDRDIDLTNLHVAHRADFIRAFLLTRFGGLWIDSDCLVMQSLEPVLDLVEQHDFVAHRERSGHLSVGFLGARPGSRIAAAHYQRLCTILRSRRRLGWISLGSEPLAESVAGADAEWYEMPCERIQPICWSNPSAFLSRGDAATHERALDVQALCYMLSNTEINRCSGKAAESLMEPDTFFTYLLHRSLGRPAEVGEQPARVISCLSSEAEQVPYESIFGEMVEAYRRFGDESLSGPGSCLAQTAELRSRLPVLLEDIGVRSLLDAPCGDFHWMKEIALGIDEYTGIDILSEIVAHNSRCHGGPGRRFLRLDLTRDPLPRADCILCRDFLVHLSFDEAFRALRNIRRSGARFLLATTFTGDRVNPDTSGGRWRPLNLERAPFHFPRPERLIREGCSEAGGVYADKCLGLWRCANLPC